MSDSVARVTEIRTARQDAAQLEQRAADQVDWAGLLVEGKRDLAAADAELEGADRANLEKAAAKLEIKSGEIDKRIVGLRASLERSQGREAAG